ncbi:MAG TPA: hypothetical protein V6D27_02830 [Vampirovibrionales bacterium]
MLNLPPEKQILLQARFAVVAVAGIKTLHYKQVDAFECHLNQ